MQITLNQRLLNVLEKGVEIIQEHESLILSKWEIKLNELKLKQNKLFQEMQLIVSILSDCLFSKKTNIEELFKKLIKNYLSNIRTIEPNKLVFYITILENSIHEIIQSEIGNAYESHQAVQYLFSKINEEVFADSLNQELNFDTYLEQLVNSKQLPIKWIAKIIQTPNGFQTKQIYSRTINKNIQIEANSLFKLTEYLLEAIPSEQNEIRVFTIPWGEYTLLFGTSKPESEIMPFIMFSLQTFLDGQVAVKTTERKQQWMDAVMLFNEWIMRSKNYHEALKNITSGFVNFLPFERSALFAYSSHERNGTGLFAHSVNPEAIQKISENINNLPFIKKHLEQWEALGEHAKNIQPLYISNAMMGLPEQYVKQFQLESIVIVPIYVPSESQIIGAAIVDQGPFKKFTLNRETFLALMKCGQSAGELLSKILPNNLNLQSIEARLSPREIEVLQLISEGKSTNEAAQKLHLSEYTVRDYISTIMQKMNAKNRTEAIVKAIRKGII